MSWLLITLLAYLLLGLEVIFDKFLLSSKRVSHPALYAFYTGTTGLFTLVFIPFGFHLISAADIIYRIISGIIFIYGMLALFNAISKSEASRVMPVVGAVIPIVTFFLSIFFLNERFYIREIYGILALIIGGLWISYDFSQKENQKLFPGFFSSIIAGVLLAIAAVFFKKFYNQDNFFNVYIWTRIGIFCGVITFFFIPEWRKVLLGSLVKFKRPQKEHKESGIMFILNRATGGLGSIIKEKATSLMAASVTIVNALVSTEYIFIFLLGLIFSVWFPRVFQEKKDWRNVFQKVIAIVIITLGLALVARHK